MAKSRNRVVLVTAHETTGHENGWAQLAELQRVGYLMPRRTRWVAWSHYQGPGQLWFQKLAEAEKFIRADGRLTTQRHYRFTTL